MMCLRCQEPIYHGAKLRAVFDNEKIVVICDTCYQPEDDLGPGDDLFVRLKAFADETFGRKVRITLSELEAMVGRPYRQDRKMAKRINARLRAFGFHPCSIRLEDQRVVSGWGRL